MSVTSTLGQRKFAREAIELRTLARPGDVANGFGVDDGAMMGVVINGSAKTAMRARVSARLASFEAELRTRLAGVASVERTVEAEGQIDVVTVTPVNPSSLAVSWCDWGELQVDAGRGGGGRFELQGRASEDVDFLIDVVEAVIAGRVSETFGPNRSAVRVTLADGETAEETGIAGLMSALTPRPGWKRTGETLHYEPYRP